MPTAPPERVTPPFAPGSVSLRLYPHNELPAPEVASTLVAEAVLAEAVGFAGLMVSEHHGGFAGYLPDPVQTAAHLAASTRACFVAPAPVLLGLRPPALLAEEIAWMSARHPGRIGLGVAAGALPLDFTAMDVDPDDAVPRFLAGLPRVAAMLRGEELGDLAGDPALAHCATHPVPVVSAAVSPTAGRRAATTGVGLLLESMSTIERQRAVVDAFRESGGTGPVVAIRRVWLGAPPTDAMADQRAVYAGYAASGAQAHWGATDTLVADDATELAAAIDRSTAAVGADCVNLRVHLPGVGPDAVRSQIERLGEVLDVLRRTGSTT